MAELVYAKNLAWEHLHRLEDPFYAKTEVQAAVAAYEAKMIRVGRGISNLQNWYRSKTKNGSILRSQIITELESGKSFYVHSRNDQPVRPLLVWNDQLTSADNNSLSINANKGSWVVREGVNPQLASVLSTLIKKIEPPKPVVLRQSTKSSLPAAVSPATQANKDYDLQYQVLDRSGSPVVDVPYVMKMADGTSVEGVTESDGCTQVSPSQGASEPVKLYLAEDCLRICKAPIFHNDCEYGLVTTKKMTPRSSLAPIEVKVSVLETLEVADILFATGMNKFYLLTEEDVKELEQEEKIFIDISQRLQDAINQDGSDSKLISGNSKSSEGALLTPLKQTKAEIVDELSSTHGLSVSGGPGKLIEQRRVLGKKHYTYIRSDKMKNHWRSYDINNKKYNEEKGRWITGDKLDMEKFEKNIKDGLKDRKVEFKEDIWKADLGPGNPMFDVLNSGYHHVGISVPKDTVDEYGFDASAEAQFLRFAAGAALAGEFNPKNGIVAFDSKAEASFDLAKGNIGTSMSFPSNNYSEILIPYQVRENGQLLKKTLSLGHFQATLKLVGSGHAGASALLGANLTIDCSGGTPKFKSNGQGVSGKAELFAGVKAGGSITGELKWADKLSSAKDWKTLAQIGKSVSVAAGIGAAGELTVFFDESSGRFILRARAGLVIGPGAEGSFVLEVSALNIVQMVHFIFQALIEVDYRKVDLFATAEQFQNFVKVYFFLMVSGVKMGADVYKYGGRLMKEVAGLLKKLDSDYESSQLGKQLSENILEDSRKGESSWVLHAPPEVKGMSLYLLMVDSWLVVDLVENFDQRREAVKIILNSFQSYRDYEESVTRVNKNGSKGDFDVNADRLFEFVETERQEFEFGLLHTIPILNAPIKLDPHGVCKKVSDSLIAILRLIKLCCVVLGLALGGCKWVPGVFYSYCRGDSPHVLCSDVTEDEVNKTVQRELHNMIFVEGGFKLGDVMGTSTRPDNQTVVDVTLDDFSMSKYEVTWQSYVDFLRDTGVAKSRLPRDELYLEQSVGLSTNKVSVYYKDKPARVAGWQDASDYCAWLNEKTGLPFDLPTSAQWEYAARSRGEHVFFAIPDKEFYVILDSYHWDSSIDFEEMDRKGVFFPVNGDLFVGGTIFWHSRPVGSYKPNALGLYDMTGNVAEWVKDWYTSNYYRNIQKGTVDSHNPLNTDSSLNEKEVRDFTAVMEPTSNNTIYTKAGRWLTAESFGFRCVVNSAKPVD